jgi:hypothetical protein
MRDLPITAPLLRILQLLKSRSRFTAPEDCVLVSEVGTPINQTNIMNRRLRPIARQLGAPSLSWQAFRRTHDVLASELNEDFELSAGVLSREVETEKVEFGEKTADAMGYVRFERLRIETGSRARKMR